MAWTKAPSHHHDLGARPQGHLVGRRARGDPVNEDPRAVPADDADLLQQRVPLEGQHRDLAQDLPGRPAPHGGTGAGGGGLRCGPLGKAVACLQPALCRPQAPAPPSAHLAETQRPPGVGCGQLSGSGRSRQKQRLRGQRDWPAGSPVPAPAPQPPSLRPTVHVLPCPVSSMAREGRPHLPKHRGSRIGTCGSPRTRPPGGTLARVSVLTRTSARQ